MLVSRQQIRRVGQLLADVAERELMPRFSALSSAAIRMKSSAFDIVTEADEAAEISIRECIEKLFSNAVIVGEEAAERDPSLLELVRTVDLLVLVDPLDGTKNFVSNIPLFGPMVSIAVRSEVVGGVIYDPICRTWAYALRGVGAWSENSAGACTDFHVAAPVPISEMEGVVGTAFLPEPLRTTIGGNLSRFSMTMWFRCAAVEYRLAAAGFLHFLSYNRLLPWDHAAGWLLHREAADLARTSTANRMT